VCLFSLVRFAATGFGHFCSKWLAPLTEQAVVSARIGRT